MNETEIAKIRERRARVPEAPWFVDHDDARECGPHRDSGLALVDTGRESDWPIARLCHWPVADFIAHAPTDIDVLLTALDESQKEVAMMGAAMMTSSNSEAVEWLQRVYSLGTSDRSAVPQLNAGEMLARLDEVGLGKQEGRRGNTLWAMVMDAADEIEQLRTELANARTVIDEAVAKVKSLWTSDRGNDWNGALNKAVSELQAMKAPTEDEKQEKDTSVHAESDSSLSTSRVPKDNLLNGGVK